MSLPFLVGQRGVSMRETPLFHDVQPPKFTRD